MSRKLWGGGGVTSEWPHKQNVCDIFLASKRACKTMGNSPRGEGASPNPSVLVSICVGGFHSQESRCVERPAAPASRRHLSDFEPPLGVWGVHPEDHHTPSAEEPSRPPSSPPRHPLRCMPGSNFPGSAALTRLGEPVTLGNQILTSLGPSCHE